MQIIIKTIHEMTFKRTICAGLIILLISLSSHSQSFNESDYFRSPLDIPLYLSGNFGELRSTHFHAGLDFKTQAVVGKNVYAVADGYVSRIKIQSGGYGRAIYVSHPNGMTTVYAHLLSYNETIESFVKDYQYRNQIFEIDLYLKKNQLTLSQGEILGISGNSGSSSGPHLHFEIRKTASQRPVNGLFYNFDVRDNIKPSIRGIAIYPMDENSLVNGKNEKVILNASGSNGKYALSTRSPIAVSGKTGFGIEVYDYLNGSSNRCGIFSIEMLVDSVRVYLHEVNEIGFDEAGYVKSHVDYAEKMASGRKFQKMQIDPNNKLRFYVKSPDKRYYQFSDNQKHHVHFNVKDSYGNLSTVDFYIIATDQQAPAHAKNSSERGVFMSWQKENFFENENVRVYLPKNALFDDFYFYYKTSSGPTTYSDLHSIHNKYTPLNKYMKIYIKCDIPDDIKNKALLVRKNENGSRQAIGGNYEYGYVVSGTKYFGEYYVDVDTIAPRIVPLNISANANLSGYKSINFRINDNLSGIKSYNGYIDNTWVLFEYDAKSNLVQYFFDDEKLETGKNHTLELFIMDEKDNIATFTTSFFY